MSLVNFKIFAPFNNNDNGTQCILGFPNFSYYIIKWENMNILDLNEREKIGTGWVEYNGKKAIQRKPRGSKPCKNVSTRAQFKGDFGTTYKFTIFNFSTSELWKDQGQDNPLNPDDTKKIGISTGFTTSFSIPYKKPQAAPEISNQISFIKNTDDELDNNCTKNTINVSNNSTVQPIVTQEDTKRSERSRNEIYINKFPVGKEGGSSLQSECSRHKRPIIIKYKIVRTFLDKSGYESIDENNNKITKEFILNLENSTVEEIKNENGIIGQGNQPNKKCINLLDADLERIVNDPAYKVDMCNSYKLEFGICNEKDDIGHSVNECKFDNERFIKKNEECNDNERRYEVKICKNKKRFNNTSESPLNCFFFNI